MCVRTGHGRGATRLAGLAESTVLSHTVHQCTFAVVLRRSKTACVPETHPYVPTHRQAQARAAEGTTVAASGPDCIGPMSLRRRCAKQSCV